MKKSGQKVLKTKYTNTVDLTFLPYTNTHTKVTHKKIQYKEEVFHKKQLTTFYPSKIANLVLTMTGIDFQPGLDRNRTVDILLLEMQGNHRAL